MNTSPTGWYALYRSATDTGHRATGPARPVDGWGTDGAALVVDERTGRRQPADSIPNFARLQQTPSIVTVLPGQGWRIAYANGAPADPVIGWAVDSHGYGTPMITDCEGMASVDEELPEGGFLVPPGVRPEDSPYRSRIEPQGKPPQ
ncbi:hypothetical protein [Actinacidiphila alni]|uniref:hypothetical protein n=1 Tax=Actinacidiphila alni TaxID=380248 RepID=UPI0034532E79